MIKLDLEKVTPFPMTVPCLDGVGSCEYDICKIIENSADTLCTFFPENQPCSCPLLKGEMEIDGLELEVQVKAKLIKCKNRGYLYFPQAQVQVGE